MPGGFKTARGLAQSERAWKKKQERKAKIESGEIVIEIPTLDIDAYEKSVKDAASHRKVALKVFVDKIQKFKEQARAVDPECIKLTHGGGFGTGDHEIAPWIVELFGIKAHEIGQVFRKAKNYSSDLSDERILKFLRAWPSEEKLLKALEEFRVAAKSF